MSESLYPQNQAPSVGRSVHYVSYGTPGGEYPSVCRAAVITAIRDEQIARAAPSHLPWEVDLCVLNPEGLSFNRGVLQNEEDKRGGTWHWPERP